MIAAEIKEKHHVNKRKGQRVIELYKQGKTIREIAQEVDMSFSKNVLSRSRI